MRFLLDLTTEQGNEPARGKFVLLAKLHLLLLQKIVAPIIQSHLFKNAILFFRFNDFLDYFDQAPRFVIFGIRRRGLIPAE